MNRDQQMDIRAIRNGRGTLIGEITIIEYLLFLKQQKYINIYIFRVGSFPFLHFIRGGKARQGSQSETLSAHGQRTASLPGHISNTMVLKPGQIKSYPPTCKGFDHDR